MKVFMLKFGYKRSFKNTLMLYSKLRSELVKMNLFFELWLRVVRWKPFI